MSDEAKQGASATAQGGEAADPVKNLKAEFDRKVTKLEQANQALLAEMQKIARAPKAAPQSDDKLPDPYENPDAYAAAIEARAEKRVMARVEERETSKARMDGAVSSLYRDYPELQDSEHPLTKATLERYEAMPEERRKDPAALELAALKSAMELDVKPRSKRPADDDSFSFGGGYGGGRSSRKKSDALDPRTLEIASHMGLDVSDPKVVERIKKRAQDLEARRRK